MIRYFCLWQISENHIQDNKEQNLQVKDMENRGRYKEK